MLHARQDYQEQIQAPEHLIPLDEPVFLLRGQDQFAPELLLRWAAKLRLKRGDIKMAQKIENHAQKMIEWQDKIKVKVPDLPRKRLFRIKINEILSPCKYNGVYLSKKEITLLESSEIVDRKNYKRINYCNEIIIDNSLLRSLIGEGDEIEVEGLFKLQSNNAELPAIFIITKIL